MTVLVEVFGDVTVDSFAAEARVVRHATDVRADGTFTACASGLPPLRGRWSVRGGYVVAAGVLPC